MQKLETSHIRVRPSVTTLPDYSDVATLLSAYSGDDHLHLIYPKRIQAAAHTFLSGFPGKVMYAVKANPHPIVLKTLWAAGVRTFDVASIREIDLITSLFTEAQLYLMHPIKSRQTLHHAYAHGIRDFSFDHVDELQKIFDCTGEAADLNLHLRLALPKGGAVMPLAGKFGAEFDEAVQLLRLARPRVARLGLCFHVGSQCLDPSDYDRAIAYAAQVSKKSGVKIDSIDVGGGFPVSYPDMEIRPMNDYFQSIRGSLVENGFDGVEILGEPGRALCAEGGATLARIELRKGQDLYLNDGTYGSLFDAGSFAWKFPVRLHRNRPPAPTKTTHPFRFFGPTCDSADTMNGPFFLPADAAEGDWVEIENLGAYGHALSTRFNGFYTETTVIIDEK